MYRTDCMYLGYIDVGDALCWWQLWGDGGRLLNALTLKNANEIKKSPTNCFATNIIVAAIGKTSTSETLEKLTVRLCWFKKTDENICIMITPVQWYWNFANAKTFLLLNLRIWRSNAKLTTAPLKMPKLAHEPSDA